MNVQPRRIPANSVRNTQHKKAVEFKEEKNIQIKSGKSNKSARPTDKEILESIQKHNMIFLSAQPDTPYFHWQVEIYMYQFSEHNIKDRCYVLFGYDGDEPSAEVKRLQALYPTIITYNDGRINKSYVPSIRPYLYKKFFAEYPDLGKHVFIHDSDIFIVTMPNFKKMLEDPKNSYVSDTISYIGYDYLKECCDKYHAKNSKLDSLDLMNKMCDVVGITPQFLKARQKQSGGAQYYWRNMTYEFWDEAETLMTDLYKIMSNYEKTNPSDKHIQKWTADMWACLWLYWKRGDVTIVDKELEFAWAVGTINQYNSNNIFHLAGVTADSKKMFYKGKYNNKSVFDAYNEDRGIFDHIGKSSATKPYTEKLVEYFNRFYAPAKGYLTDDEYFETEEGQQIKEITRDARGEIINKARTERGWFSADRFDVVDCKRFRITCDDIVSVFDGDYVLDDSRKCCGKSVWRDTKNKYIMFHNGATWVVTHKQYEDQIGNNCGGIACNKCEQPYYNDWNVECLVQILCD